MPVASRTEDEKSPKTTSNNSTANTLLAKRVARLEEDQQMLQQENRELRRRIQALEELCHNDHAMASQSSTRLSAPAAATRMQAAARGRHDRRMLEEQRQAADDIIAAAVMTQEVLASMDDQGLLEAALESPKAAGNLGLVPDGVAEAFEQFDTNGDRVLDYKELRNALRAFGIDASSDFAAGLLREYDEYPDGKLDIFEFSVCPTAGSKQRPPEQCPRLLSRASSTLALQRLVKDLQLMLRQQEKHEAELRVLREEITQAAVTTASPAGQGIKVGALPQQQAYVLVTDPNTGGQLLLPLPPQGGVPNMGA